MAKSDWFVHDRLGMFIHWGIYSLPARHEWIKNREQISDEDYQKYFDHFDPDPTIRRFGRRRRDGPA